VSDCIFCRLLAGDGEVSVVHENERAVVFMDIQPLVRGHMLSVPRAHAASLADLGQEDGAAVFDAARLAAAALRASPLRCEGVNLFLADGEAAGQDVFHAHLHVVPRHAGDGLGLLPPPGYSIRPREELDAAADALRQLWPST